MRGAEIAGHLGQGHVDDRGVQHLHDRGGDQAEQDQPPIAHDVGLAGVGVNGGALARAGLGRYSFRKQRGTS